MKRLLELLVIAAIAALAIGCRQTKPEPVAEEEVDSIQVVEQIVDSTVYGVCGDGTMMNTLELIADGGDTLYYSMAEDDAATDIQGGMMIGDRMAVMGTASSEGLIADKVINLTTLMGKWMSLDKNFELLEGGMVNSTVETESNPWVSWKILNGHLLLNTDTFDIVGLGADSLYIESRNGIFVYRRAQ